MEADFAALQQILKNLGPFGVAFSGGLDSRFLTHAALLAGLKPRLVHVTGPHIPQCETAFAVAWAEARGADLTLIPADPLALPAVAAGARDRCYHCKHWLFTRLLEIVGAPLCDGSNLSDRGGYRPGLRALAELGIRSPLAEAGLTKPRLRELARLTGMERPEQQARPCLLTRLDYDQPPNAALLATLAELEEEVEAHLRVWYPEQPEAPDFRVRCLAAPDRFALHAAVALSPAREAALQAALAARGLPALKVLPPEPGGLSGYFDRPQATPQTGPQP